MNAQTTVYVCERPPVREGPPLVDGKARFVVRSADVVARVIRDGRLHIRSILLGYGRPHAMTIAKLTAFFVLLPRIAAAADPTETASLRLQDAVQLAVARNERAQISDLQVVVAEAGVARARAGFLPVVALTASDQQHLGAVSSSTTNVGNSSATVNQPLVNAPAWPLYSQAKALAEAQRAQNVDDKRLLSFSAATAFFAVLNADDFLQAAQRQLEMAKANLADTQARAEAGLTSSNDVTRARVDIGSAERQVEADKGNFDNAFVQLELTINARVSGALVPPEATLRAAQQSPGQVNALVKFATDRRPDVLAAKHATAAAHHFASEPLLRLVPTLGVQGALTATTSPPPTGHWNDETVTATLSWTLYDAGVRYADKRSRDAQATIADLTLQQLLRSVDAQVRSAVALLVSAQAALRVADDAVKAARQSVEETAILYRQGLAKAIELVDANDGRFTAEVNYAGAEYALAVAYLTLRQAMGLDPLGTELQ
jgi:outer membrane protein TolC